MNSITAVIDSVKEPESIPYGDGKTFDKQVFHATIEGKRSTTYLEFEMTGDDMGKLSSSDEGRKAEIKFFLNGRKGKEGTAYSDRVFVSLKYAGHDFVDAEPEVVAPEVVDPSESLPF